MIFCVFWWFLAGFNGFGGFCVFLRRKASVGKTRIVESGGGDERRAKCFLCAY